MNNIYKTTIFSIMLIGFFAFGMEKDCVICTDSKPANSFVTLSCTHEFCSGCLADQLSTGGNVRHEHNIYRYVQECAMCRAIIQPAELTTLIKTLQQKNLLADYNIEKRANAAIDAYIEETEQKEAEAIFMTLCSDRSFSQAAQEFRISNPQHASFLENKVKNSLKGFYLTYKDDKNPTEIASGFRKRYPEYSAVIDVDQYITYLRFKKFIPAAVYGGISFALAGYACISASFQKKSLQTITTIAQELIDNVSNFDFDPDDLNMLSVQKQCDVESLLQRITSTEKRDSLHRAIISFDASLKAVINRISTHYFHKSYDEFMQKEPLMLNTLHQDFVALEQAVQEACDSVKSSRLIKNIAGIFALAGIGSLIFAKG